MCASARQRRLKLRTRFVLSVVLGVVLITVGLVALSYYEASHALKDSRRDHLLALARARSNQLARHLERVSGVPSSLAAALAVLGFPAEGAITPLLQREVQDHALVYGMALAFAPYAFRPDRQWHAPYVFRNKHGFKSLNLNTPSYNYPKRAWFRLPAQKKQAMWSEPYFDEGGGQVAMTTFSAPVIKNGKVLAVITADVRLRDLFRQAQQLSVGRHGLAFVLSRHGAFLAAPKPAWNLRRNIFALARRLELPGLAQAGRRMMRGESGVVLTRDWRDGQPAWLAFAPVSGLGWSFAVMLPEREVLAPVVRLARHHAYGALAGVALMALLVTVLVMSFTRPLQRLTQAVRRLAQGDLCSRVEGVPPGDEVGEMAEAFNQMAAQIQQHIAELERKKQEVQAAMDKVSLLETIQGHLSKFVPQSVRRIIKESPQAPDLSKHEQDVSILFLDVAGYTRMSEHATTGRMNFLIECYFSAFLDDIYQNQGDINETAGDGLMIIFQDQDPKQHALNAVRTAAAIRRKVAEVNQDLEDIGELVQVNIGINSGMAMVGSSRFEGVGGDRWTYTASGPVTNIAARIGAKATEGRIFIGQETARRVEGRFTLQDRGDFKLKNVEQPVRVFEVLETAAEA